MSVDQIKREITILTPSEQNEVTAFLFHLRHREDLSYRDVIDQRINDSNAGNWLSPEEFEIQLDQR